VNGVAPETTNGSDAEQTGSSRGAFFRLFVFCAVALAAVGVAYVATLRHVDAIAGAPFPMPLLVLVLGFTLTEFLSVNLESRTEAHQVNFVELMYVPALLLASPADLVLGRILSGVLVFGIIRRQSPHKAVANVTVFGVEAAVAALVFHAVIGGASPVTTQGWLAVFAAVMASYYTAAGIVTAVITLFSAWPGRRMIWQVFGVAAVVALANTSIGVAVMSGVWNRDYGVLWFSSVVVVLFALYRAYTRLTERHKSLETLHDFTRGIEGSLELLALEREVLGGAREILRAEHGALLLPPVREGERGSRLIARGEQMERAAIAPEELLADLTLLMPEGVSRLIEPGDPLPAWLAAIGVRDGMVVPVTAEGLPTGAMVVANRLTEVSTFSDDDLRVLETLARHGGVALENGRLVDTLQHEASEKAYQAMHDPVTELPNRRALTEELELELSRARTAGRSVALILVDLYTFKEVSDTLGLATAEELLCEVRDRLEHLLSPGAMLARYTGDSFALLVPGFDVDEAMGLAEEIHGVFDEPLTSENVSLMLSASLGVALHPEHAGTADVLLQRADAATYAARLDGSGIELYSQENDPYAPRRLALAGELREALDQAMVDVFVQPKVSVQDGTVRGAEALVRWTHPRLGPIRPDQFIPAAEHTGVIRPLTLYVMRSALTQCRAWRDAGYDLGVAVNLSVRNLFDGHLVEDLRQLLVELQVPPGALTLELTESIVMGESSRSMEVLEGIWDLGVGLSVDDFGTGYSSLAHLRRLPVTELKIDRSFVSTMTVNEHDAVIVRSLVELGRNLGLATVAEGVESQEAMDLLGSYGCDMAQGYLISRPLPPDQFVAWLGRQPRERLPHLSVVVPLPLQRRPAE
jgi:diguanylate cyclase (GGDEF)-like protein